MDCLLNICRVCLTEQGEFQSVFISDESSGLNIHLAEMLMACASIQVTFGDGLPEQICKICADKTVSLFLFKIKCEDSDSKLRNQLGKSPLKEDYISIPFDSVSDSNIILESPQSSLHDIIVDDTDHKDDLVDTFQSFGNESEEMNINQETNENNRVEFYKCKLCPKVYNRYSNLIRHVKFHTNDQLFKCEICDKKFTREDLLERHKIAHAKKNNQELDRHISSNSKDCTTKEPTLDIQDINNSEVKENNQKEESVENDKRDELEVEGEDCTCRICKKKFVKMSRLKRHMKTHAAVKPFKCQICFKGFTRQELYRNHMNTHTGNKPHVCNICKKGFNQISNLKDHMRTHNGEKPFLCSTCGKGFNQLGNLRQHTVRHSGIKAHICSMCGNGFASKGELAAHLRKHTGARPFVCPICQSGFTTSSSLTKHKRIHSGEKPYECDVCQMKFSRNGILSRHKRIHTGEKPYVCTYCNKAFTQSNDLNSHLRIHTGEKPFICDQCGQAFRQSSALKTHKRVHVKFKSFPNSDGEGKTAEPTEEENAFLETRFDFESNTWTYMKKIELDV
ncbi:zinc finger protein 391-like [Harmonia axyridis]|uniref:zinc finger protein 391-like n=1 Tax=Harmonia axyridis TaxID=115357 RepID=UPI001E277A85|nr:zinc finger protein 391-like [Harmonia axyridis]